MRSGVLTTLLFLTCLKIWIGPTPILSPAQAQIPDSGMQRKQLLVEARRTNQLLVEIKQFLATQTLNVRIEGADNQGADNKRRSGSKARRSGR